MAGLEVRVTLTVTEGPDEGATFSLRDSRTTLGRRGTDIRINDAKASICHAAIDITGSEVYITDLKSRNGLFLNGAKVTRGRLSNLDEIQIGVTKFKAVILEDLEAFKRRNRPSEAGKTPIHGPGDIGAMIDDELKQFSRWDLSDPSTEAITSGDVMAASRAYSFEVLQGPDAGRRFPIEKKMTTVGRSNADIRLKDLDVSRLHVEIEVLPDGKVILRDLGSTNGTFVNGKKTTETQITAQDKIKIGNTVIRFVSDKK
ncbi:MAG: FHA domain-containing protein [Pseudomonadota bacterium]